MDYQTWNRKGRVILHEMLIIHPHLLFVRKTMHLHRKKKKTRCTYVGKKKTNKKTMHLHREKEMMHLHRERQTMLLHREEQTMHLHRKMPNDALTSLVRKEWEFIHDGFMSLVGKEF